MDEHLDGAATETVLNPELSPPLHITPEDLELWGKTIDARLTAAEEAETRIPEMRQRQNELYKAHDARIAASRNRVEELDAEFEAFLRTEKHIKTEAAFQSYLKDRQSWIETIEAAEAGTKQLIAEDPAESDPELSAFSPQAIDREIGRSTSQKEAIGWNQVLLYADEVDLAPYARYLQPGGTPLDSHFSLPAEEPPTDPMEAAQKLSTLPFVAPQQVSKPYGQRILHPPGVILEGEIPFPLDRIVSASSFQSWAGRGELGEAEKEPHIAGNEHKYQHPIASNSRGTITAYAHQQMELVDVSLTIFRDAAGEYWAMSTGDSSHRLAAAKLRGERAIIASQIHITSEENMETVPYSVREHFSGSAGE